MKFGAHSQMFAHEIAEDPRGVLRTVRELGMDAIEINVGDPATFPVGEVVAGVAEVEVVAGVAATVAAATIVASSSSGSLPSG